MTAEYDEVEDPVCAHARKKGWLCWKFTSPNLRGVPDRIFVAPWGMTCFIEFKKPGERVEKGSPQERRLNDLVSRGANVFVISEAEPGCGLIDLLSTQEGYMNFAMQLAAEAEEMRREAGPRIITSPVPTKVQ